MNISLVKRFVSRLLKQCILLFVFVIFTYLQARPQSENWFKPLADSIQYHEGVFGLIKVQERNYLLSSFRDTAHFGSFTLAGEENHNNLALIEYDSTGQINAAINISPVVPQYSNTSPSSMIMVTGLTQGSDGGVIVYFNSKKASFNTGDTTFNASTNLPYNKIMVVKFSANLVYEWSRTIIPSALLSIKIRSNSSGIPVINYTHHGSLTFEDTTIGQVDQGYYIILNENGDFEKVIPGPCTDFAVDDSMNIYSAYERTVGATYGILLTDSTYEFSTDSLVTMITYKLDTAGQIHWVTEATITGEINVNDVHINDQGFYLTGDLKIREFFYSSGWVAVNYPHADFGGLLIEDSLFTGSHFFARMSHQGTYEFLDYSMTAFATMNKGKAITQISPERLMIKLEGDYGLNAFGESRTENSNTHYYFIRFDEGLNSGSLFYEKKKLGYSGGSGSTDAYINPKHMLWNNDQLYLAGSCTFGVFFRDDTIFTTTIPLITAESFVASIKNCDYMSPGVLGPLGASAWCGSTNIILAAEGHQGYEMQWLYNGSPINGATDSTYNVLTNGAYNLIISDSVCKVVSDTFKVHSSQPPPASLNLSATAYCQQDSVVVLSGGSPLGGTYQLNGSSASTFNPSQFNAGFYQVVYHYEDTTHGCPDTAQQTIEILEAPNVAFFQNFSSICFNDTQTLSSGYPAGGWYGGAGVVGNQLIGPLADTGSHSLWYSYTSANGCVASDSIEVNVIPQPAVSFNWTTTSTCEAHGPIAFNGYAPSGGSFSGQGVSGQYFVPGIVAPGQYAVTYAIDSAGCTSEVVQWVQVDSFPDVVLPPLDSVCNAANDLPLEHGNPSGGTYSGNHVSNNLFDATAAGLGTHSIRYIFENSCAADTSNSTIFVIADPSISISGVEPSCFGASNGQLQATISGGNQPYQVTWSNGDSSLTSTNLNAGQHIITITGEGGCVQTDSVVLGQPDSFYVSIDSLSHVSCNAFSDGKSWTSTQGGTGPYSFLWPDGQNTDDATNLAAGNHMITVTDQNGCTTNATAIIQQLNPIELAISKSDISCFSANDGTASVIASGGNSNNYQFAWNTGDTIDSLNGLSDGMYIITVSDTINCTATDTIQILRPAQLNASLTLHEPSCFQAADGSMVAVATGGRSPYSYHWSHGPTTDSIAAITTGVYSVIVTDSSGCTALASDSLGQPSELSIAFQVDQSISCYGASNGALQSTVTGGTAAYQYAWNTGDTNALLAQIPAGLYHLEVTDANGCTGLDSTAIGQPDSMIIQMDSMEHPTCYQSQNGFVAISSIGGIAPHAYEWNNGTDTNVLQSLPADTYSVTVYDANGCTTHQQITLSEPDEIQLSLSASAPLCYGDSNAWARVEVLLQQGDYTAAWSTNQVGDSATNLSTGWVSVTITDSAGCTVVDSTFIDQPPAIYATFDIQDVLCHGSSEGTIAASVFNGQSPIEFTWSNGSDSSVLYQVMAGTYQLSLVDSLGCEFDTSLVIDQPPALALIVDTITHQLCHGDSMGQIALFATGGTPSYLYQWGDSVNGPIRTSLWADTFDVSIIDSNGCVLDTSLVIAQPDPLQLIIDGASELLCYNSATGFITTSAFGGLQPYQYLWSTNEDSSHVAGLAAGIYTLTVTDSNNCQSVLSHALQQSDSLELQYQTFPATCSNSADGSITVDPQGGSAPFAYSWNTGDTISQLQNLLSGPYFLTVTDSNQCLDSLEIFLDFDHFSPAPELGVDTAVCSNDVILLDPTTSAALDHQWSTGESSTAILVSAQGVYSVTVSDSNGCQGIDSIAVMINPLPVFSLGGDVFICHDSLDTGLILNGPIGAYDYLWSNSATVQLTTVYDTGTYWLSVRDTNQCIYSDSLVVVDDTCLGIISQGRDMQLKLWPNPSNGLFHLTSEVDQPMELKLFDSSGNLVRVIHHHHGKSTIDLSSFAAGTYHLRAIVEKGIIHIPVLLMH